MEQLQVKFLQYRNYKGKSYRPGKTAVMEARYAKVLKAQNALEIIGKAEDQEEKALNAAPENKAFTPEENKDLHNLDPKKEEEPETDPEQDNEDTGEKVYPVSTGGGWYQLSNGEKIQGKAEAIEAEENLKGE
jgi:hypothetical protein